MKHVTGKTIVFYTHPNDIMLALLMLFVHCERCHVKTKNDAISQNHELDAHIEKYRTMSSDIYEIVKPVFNEYISLGCTSCMVIQDSENENALVMIPKRILSVNRNMIPGLQKNMQFNSVTIDVYTDVLESDFEFIKSIESIESL